MPCLIIMMSILLLYVAFLNVSAITETKSIITDLIRDEKVKEMKIKDYLSTEKED